MTFSDLFKVTIIQRHIDIALDRPYSTGLEQFTSGTLEACHPPWQCCWSDATAPGGNEYFSHISSKCVQYSCEYWWHWTDDGADRAQT